MAASGSNDPVPPSDPSSITTMNTPLTVRSVRRNGAGVRILSQRDEEHQTTTPQILATNEPEEDLSLSSIPYEVNPIQTRQTPPTTPTMDEENAIATGIVRPFDEAIMDTTYTRTTPLGKNLSKSSKALMIHDDVEDVSPSMTYVSSGSSDTGGMMGYLPEDEQAATAMAAVPVHSKSNNNNKKKPAGGGRRSKYLVVAALVLFLALAGAAVGILFGAGVVGDSGSRSSQEQATAPSTNIDFTASPTSPPTSAPVVVSTPVPVVISTPAPVVQSTPAPVTPAPTLAPVVESTPAPITQAPTVGEPEDDPAVQMRNLLVPVTGDVIDDPATPQGRAFSVLVDTWEEPVELGEESRSFLTQRFAVLTTLFSLTNVNALADLPFGVFVTSSPDECEWPIATCGLPDATGFRAMTELVLNDQRTLVTGTIPPELGLVTTLQAIDLGENAISGPIPEELFALQQLKNLFLHSNRMTGTLSESIKNWPFLEKLYLGYNEFDGPIPENLRSAALDPVFGLAIRPLRYLNLNHNKFSGTIPSGLRLRQLFYLDLGFNDLTGLLPDDLGTTSPSLRHIYLDHNQFEGEIPESYTSVGNQRLISFVMNNNNFVGGLPNGWGEDHDKILTIKVQNNQLTEEIDKDICKFDVFEENELVELSADCNICSCGDRLCGDCYN